MKICHAKHRSIQLSGVFQALLMFIPALLKKRLVLSHPILGTALIFVVLGFFAGCGGGRSGGRNTRLGSPDGFRVLPKT